LALPEPAVIAAGSATFSSSLDVPVVSLDEPQAAQASAIIAMLIQALGKLLRTCEIFDDLDDRSTDSTTRSCSPHGLLARTLWQHKVLVT
jgi:hypothetical protein